MSWFKQAIKVAKENDPSVKSTAEIIFTHAGFQALFFHRISHFFYQKKWYLFARINAQITRFFTGVEIHPGAKIAPGVFIDHGMGIVIGETAEIETGVILYHGVTLGGTGKHKTKRHPTVKKGALISAHAQVLGPITIGEFAKIGASAVVLEDIPDQATAVGIPAKVVRVKGEKIDND